MVNICLQCGDVGFDNAYVYCVTCLKFVVHRYCLPEIPKTFDEFVHWVCDDCEAVCSGSACKKALLNAQDGGNCTESVVFASTSGSNKKIISQSSPGEDESYSQTGPIVQSLHENFVSGGDDQVPADCSLSGAETNANKDRYQKENVPKKYEHQSDTSQKLEGVEEVKVAAVESLQFQETNLRKKTDASSSVFGNEKQKMPTTSYQKIYYGQHQSDIYQHHGKEDAEVVAGKFSKRRRLRENSDFSSSVHEKEKQRQTTSNDFPPAYQKIFDDAPTRFSPLPIGSKRSNSRRIIGVKETKVVAQGSSHKPKLALKSHISTSVTRKEKQMRWSTSPNGFQSRQPKRFGDRSPRDPSRNELKKVRPHSPVNITKQRYNGRYSWQTKEARRLHNIICEREKKRVKEGSSVIPTRSSVNKEVLQQTHEARRAVHNTVLERDKEFVKEEPLVIPTRSNVNDERKIHKAKRPVHITVQERGKEQVKEKSLVMATRSNIIEEVSHNPLTTPPIAGPSSYTIQVQPVVDPIWWGRFNIVNEKGNTFERLVSHLSTRACQQVIEEARQLPSLLQLEMVPKSTVWPKSFQTAKPTDDNIALYIFPGDTSSEKRFDGLVGDMSKSKLAMRTTTKNAELLIFSSTELPMEYWRFENKYYIWGVFKAKSRRSSDIPENGVNANLGRR